MINDESDPEIATIAFREESRIDASPVDAVISTPGPWKNRRLRDNTGKPYSTLYECHVDLGPCMIWCPEGNAEQEANARLISAAPELAEALRALHDFASVSSHCRHEDRSKAAFAKAAELLKRVGF